MAVKPWSNRALTGFFEDSRTLRTLTAEKPKQHKKLRPSKTRIRSGWDDPRLPTLRGLRRRGVPAEAIRDFISRLAVTKNVGAIEIAMFEACVRECLNRTAMRRMAVLRPLKVIIENYPEGEGELLDAANMPGDPAAGSRPIPFSRELYFSWSGL